MLTMDEKAKTFVLNALTEKPLAIAETLRNVKSRRFFALELRHSMETSGQRIFILAGLRGSGKTTVLYQLLAETEAQNVAYFSCDELLSREIALEEVVSTLDIVKKESIGIRNKFLLLLDEVTYLPKWDLKLKTLGDSRPNLVIVATSSSSIPLKKTLELARRSCEIEALPLSFREYLVLKYSVTLTDGLAAAIRHKAGRESLEPEYVAVRTALGNLNLFGLYEEYVRHDLPFALTLSDHAYRDAVVGTVKRIIYEDLSKYEKFETPLLSAAEVLIQYLSTIPADGVKIATLAEVTGISKESVVKLLGAFEMAMLIRGVECAGRNRRYKKPRKWFFYSSSLRLILASPVSSPSDLTGNLREDSVFRHLLAWPGGIFYSHEADFIAGGLKFEVGGKKAARKDTVILGMDERIGVNRIPIPLFVLSA